MAVLADISGRDLLAELARLQEENAKLKARGQSVLRCKVSDKGAVSVYGMGKWPVTLYASQWRRLIEFCPQITEFLADNSDKISEKD
jgi:hypothetical protein